jgi:hypothetical protein
MGELWSSREKREGEEGEEMGEEEGEEENRKWGLIQVVIGNKIKWIEKRKEWRDIWSCEVCIDFN